MPTPEEPYLPERLMSEYSPALGGSKAQPPIDLKGKFQALRASDRIHDAEMSIDAEPYFLPDYSDGYRIHWKYGGRVDLALSLKGLRRDGDKVQRAIEAFLDVMLEE